ncbi:hypothetical protein CCR75_007381 [Bremia lactucae]|uniref:Uncharacterized protein n=1 Tax=Bremia lactucae TaxID=4779 RepID=A0A976FFZ2_BRELC|nr:hypothetical protein CCR75_007381 [Bremia lactucae]
MASCTWRNVPLLDACSSLTSDGVQLLEHIENEERLVIITLMGTSSTRTRRCELMAKLLGQTEAAIPSSHDESLVLLASVINLDDEFQMLPLSPKQLVGVFCALSSLVISCFEDNGSPSSLAPYLPQFQSLFQALTKEFALMEVFDMLPQMLSIDWSTDRSLGDMLADFENENSVCIANTLARLVKYMNLGICYPPGAVQMTFDDFTGVQATVKRLFGLEMTGEMFSALLQNVLVQLLKQEPLDFGSAWDDHVEDKCRGLAEDALNTYVDCVHPAVLEHPPIEFDALKQLHEEIWRLSMDIYHSASKYKSARYRHVRNMLKSDIRSLYETEVKTLTQKSRKYCQEVRQTLWTDLFKCASQRCRSETFTATLTAIQDFDKYYAEKARGPEKAAVLRDFYQHEAIQAFYQLEGAVIQQLSESQTKELRLDLEKDFNDKKQALVEYFKIEEAHLRSGMVRDLETMQKMHEAKSIRANIDESETRRLRGEVSELKRQNLEQQDKLIVLEHAQNEAMTQKSVLNTQVADLEAAMQREVINRTELLETLALTIKAAEEKEIELNKKINDLQLEVEKKTFRVESELLDLTQQVRKTNEEKEELQKKLNDFFLKVTALPETLQHHFFCLETAHPVDFAGALTSFMS